MKKTYISPLVTVCKMDAENVVASSLRINDKADNFEGRVNENEGYEDIWELFN